MTAQAARSGTGAAWAAAVEVLAGVAAFAVAFVTWALQLFAPLYALDGTCISCRPRYGRVSLMDAALGPGNFARFYPGVARLILAVLLLTGLVALGAGLHGLGRGWIGRVGRGLLGGASLLLALLLPGVAYTLAVLPLVLPVTPSMPLQLLPGTDTLGLGLGLSGGLALLAALLAAETTAPSARARRGPRPAAAVVGGGAAEGGAAGAGAPHGAAAGQWRRRTAVLAGTLAFALALLTWAVSLFAPLYYDAPTCNQGGCAPIVYVSLVARAGGPGAFVRQFPVVALLILAVLLLTGGVALGAGLQSRPAGRGRGVGRGLLGGGSVLLPLVASALAVLPLRNLLFAYSDSRLPYPLWPVGEGVPGTDLLALVVAPSLCGALALVAALTARGGQRGGREGSMATRTTLSSARAAGATWVEAVAGLGAFTVALVTWALQLFAPSVRMEWFLLQLPPPPVRPRERGGFDPRPG